MKRKFIFILFFGIVLGVGFKAFAETDTLTGESLACDGTNFLWWNIANPGAYNNQRLYADSGNVYRCNYSPGYYRRCGWFNWFWCWESPKRNWVTEKSYCYSTDNARRYPSSNDYAWEAPNTWIKCWVPRCTKTVNDTNTGEKVKTYFAGNMGTGAIGETCEECSMPVVELVRSDPTEVSYIKIVKTVGRACPENANLNAECTGYKSDVKFEDLSGDATRARSSGNCITDGCKCNGTVLDFKESGTDEPMAKCS